MRWICVFVFSLVLANPVAAKPPLNTVAEIDNGLMVIAIADEIRNRCDGINARMLRAVGRISALKNKAKSMGYSEKEIDAYVTSKAEKARMRSKAERYLAGQGVPKGDLDALCRFGKAQIAQGGAIGTLLR